MEYQGRTTYQPRDVDFNEYSAPEKFLPETFIGGVLEDDDESEKYYSDDEDDQVSCFRRPGFILVSCGTIALAIIVALFVRSLNSGSEPVPMPSVAPPEMVLHRPLVRAPAPPPVLPVVLPKPTTLASTVQATTTPNPLLPVVDRHDHNVCTESEELYAGLCYKRCSMLTKNTHPIRTSSWTCCEREPCGFGNQIGQVGATLVCNGYDVDGDGNCPHQPGACLTNEELLLGQCYEKCSILTQGKFLVRIAPATCCKSDNLLGCFDIRKDSTSPAFNIGGGQGDHDQSTPNIAHPPLADLTESAKTAAQLYGSQTPTLPPGAGGHAPTDFSTCAADEELYAGLCYKKCSLLTGGSDSIRTSSWTCCAGHPCGLNNQKGSVGTAVLCNGFDVGGSGAVKFGSALSCPHKPGGCKSNEEMLLGMCYTKCSFLTHGQFPFRLTADSCCQEQGLRACLDIRKVATSSDYNVGILT